MWLLNSGIILVICWRELLSFLEGHPSLGVVPRALPTLNDDNKQIAAPRNINLKKKKKVVLFSYVTNNNSVVSTNQACVSWMELM